MNCPEGAQEEGSATAKEEGAWKELPSTPSIGNDLNYPSNTVLPSPCQPASQLQSLGDLPGCVELPEPPARQCGGQAEGLQSLFARLYSVQLAVCFHPDLQQFQASAPEVGTLDGRPSLNGRAVQDREGV